jgi:hypothetical protein
MIMRNTNSASRNTELELTEKELNKVVGTGLYMNFAGIKGDVTTDDWKERWIEMGSFQYQ